MTKVRTPGGHLKKRQITLQMGLTGDPDQPQPPLAIIFRGQGQRISPSERDQYDPRVKILWQAKAWMDRATQKKFVDTVLKPYLEANFTENGELQETLGLYDSLDAQKSLEFNNSVRALRHRPFHGPCGETEIWQPIDCGGIGALVKQLMRIEQENWLLKKSNWRSWTRNSLKVSERRVLLTVWAAEAWEKVTTSYKVAINSAFTKSGCNVVPSGEKDDQIRVRGLPDWKAPAINAVLSNECEFKNKAINQMKMWLPPTSEDNDDVPEGEISSGTDASDSDSDDSSVSSDSTSSSASLGDVLALDEGEFDPPVASGGEIESEALAEKIRDEISAELQEAIRYRNL